MNKKDEEDCHQHYKLYVKYNNNYKNTKLN